MSDQDQDRLLEATRTVARAKADAHEQALFEAAHPAHLAAVLRQLPLAEQVALLRALSRGRAGERIPHLDDQALLELVRVLDEVEVSQILDEMPAEHAADVVDELPPAQRDKSLA